MAMYIDTSHEESYTMHVLVQLLYHSQEVSLLIVKLSHADHGRLDYWK